MKVNNVHFFFKEQRYISLNDLLLGNFLNAKTRAHDVNTHTCTLYSKEEL